jgi:hypothetical protein
MSSEREYSYTVYGTQGGGLVRWVNGTYIFVEKPDCPSLDIGDEMPKEWGVAPANEHARQAMDDAEEFGRVVEEFFDLAFAKAERGEMTYGQIEQFFPSEVRNLIPPLGEFDV